MSEVEPLGVASENASAGDLVKLAGEKKCKHAATTLNVKKASTAHELTVDQEFADLCPALTPEELGKLEALLESEGCRDPIVTWANHDDTILDGHTRYRICRQFNIPFKTTAMALATREEAVNWIIDNQLGRRNVTEDQKKFLRGKRYQAEKKAEGGRSDRDVSGGQIVHPKTADRLGAEYGVSGATIRRDAQFAKSVDVIAAAAGPEIKKEILAGTSQLTKKEIVEAAQLTKKEIKERLETKKEKAETHKRPSDIFRAENNLRRAVESAFRNRPKKQHPRLLKVIQQALFIYEVKCELTFEEPARDE